MQIVQDFNWNEMKSDPSQYYQDKPSDQEARIDDIFKIAQDKTHLRKAVPTDYERMSNLWLRVPQGYRNYVKVTRAKDPFDANAILTLAQLVEEFDLFHQQEDDKASKYAKSNRNEGGSGS